MRIYTKRKRSGASAKFALADRSLVTHCKLNRVHRAESRDSDNNRIALDCPAKDHLLAVARLATTESEMSALPVSGSVFLQTLDAHDRNTCAKYW
jgi:hypothetical protein